MQWRRPPWSFDHGGAISGKCLANSRLPRDCPAGQLERAHLGDGAAVVANQALLADLEKVSATTQQAQGFVSLGLRQRRDAGNGCKQSGGEIPQA